MDSKIRIYQVEFKPDQNAVVESLQQYLKTATLRYKSDTFQYQQIAIDMVIKVPMEQSQLNIPGNYVEIIQDNIHYYFYIMNAKWTAKNTLRLVLSMDTLNTFWTEIQACLDKQTHVSRKYYDRWKRVDTKIYPLIDNHPEDITQPYMRRNNNVNVVGNTKHWTLVYITDYAAGESLSQNPTNCLAISEVEQPLDGTINTPLTQNSLAPGTVVAADYEHNRGMSITFNGITYTIDGESKQFMMRFTSSKKIEINAFEVNNWRYWSDIESVAVNKTTALYIQPSTYDILTDTSKKYWKWDDPVYFNGSSLTPFSVWYKTHKTDNRLIKIIELPYAPFEVSYDTHNKFIVPNGWVVLADGTLKLNNPDVSFTSHVYNYASLGPQSIDMSTLSLTEQAEPLLYETKLWNSNYYTYKFIYDSNVHVVKLEDFTQPGAKPAYGVDVSFEASTGMDGSVMFKFDSNEIVDTDFGEYLVCNRSTEIPYYTNEYLNYLRYGKAVDERNRNLSTLSTAVSGVGSGISTAASLAFALTGAGAASGGIVGGVIGAAVGLVATTIATASSIVKASDQINAKIDNYKHQASGVSASTDLSVFKTYGKNKLLLTAYEPVQELKESIGRYFELYGYSCDFYGVPNLKTRIWSDYFVMEPVFYQNPILEAYQEDIATRMKAGFRIFHRNDDISNENGVLIHYDFNNEYENWERSITGR